MLFPDLGQDEISPEIAIIKDIALIELQLMAKNMGRMAYVELAMKKEALEKQLEEYRQSASKTLVTILIENFTNFDELCMSMSKFDMKLSFKEIASLSVYEFHRMHSFIHKTNKKGKTKEDD